MSHRQEKRLRRTARTAFMAAVSLDLLAIALPSAAQAQGTPAASQEEDEMGEIVVTGFRASLQSALANKRNAIQPIESIAPEDIGKMPDQNVAESLQRVPGVQINRSGGKGTQVLIHGLSNNLITLNGEVFLTGREFYTSGEASGGGAGGNVQYSSLEGIPSEEIGGIDVIKNPTAANSEGGLGGTINLKTRSALAQQDGFSLGGNVRFSEAEDADGGATPNVTLVGGYKFGENFAITASASYDEQDTHNKEFQDQNRNQWLITNAAQNGNYVGSPAPGTLSTLPGGQLYIIPQLAYFTDQLQTVTTKGATLGLEWKWSEDISSAFNYFYVDEEDESTSYSNKVWFNGQGSAPGTLHPGIDPSQPYEIDDNGVVQSATFMANGAETATLYQILKSTSHNVQFLTKFEGDGKLTGDVGAYYAEADSELQAAQADVEHGRYNYFGGGTVAGGPASAAAPGCNNGGASCTDGNHGYRFTWTNGGTSGLPTVSYPDGFGYTNLLFNPAYTTFKSNWAWANFGDESKAALAGNAHFKFNETLTLSSGLRLTDRNVHQTFGRYLIDGATVGYGGVAAGRAAGNCCIAAGQSGTNIYYSDPGYAAIPFTITGANPAGSPGVSLPALGLVYDSFGSGQIMVKDPTMGGMTDPATYLSTLWAQGGHANPAQNLFVDTLSSFEVEEKTVAAYLMGDVGDSEADYHANFGLRVVKTELQVDGGTQLPVPTWYGTASWNGVNSNNAAFTNSRSYTDVLPSFNFTLNVTENQKVRVGAARVVAPQNLMQLGVGQSYNFTRGADGPGGQARFRFATGSSGNPDLDPFRATQYFVSWEDYVGDNGLFSVGTFYKQVDNFVATANIPTLVNDDFGGTVGTVSTPVNAGKGKIYGAELAAQYAWEVGLGVAANYTYSKSQSDQDTSFAQDLPIPGVSKNSTNFTVYFEKMGFSARAAYTWRDKSVNSSLVGSTFAFPDQTGAQVVYGVYAAPYSQLDAQIGYDFKLGDSDLGVVFSANNITNETQHTYLQYKNLPFTYNDTGRRLFLGVKFKL